MRYPQSTLSAIILTYNEEKHIRRCLVRALDFCREVFVVDSFSTDRTPEICRQFSRVHLVQHDWPGNQAQQFNWALGHLPLKTDWILRLDADEYLLPGEGERLLLLLNEQPKDVNGIILHRLRYFLGKHIRFGGTDRIPLLRVFRRGCARCEYRAMDEHLVLTGGQVLTGDIIFADNNLEPLENWLNKHLNYAHREASTMLHENRAENHLHRSLRNKRRSKAGYARFPMFWRAAGYFLYRYIIRLGFLDGREGFLWHFLQGWWYRTVVDQFLREKSRQT